ncbi:MAG: hypothetical protein ABIA37_03660 [Candidatus Woesearchaeota archaeon]
MTNSLKPLGTGKPKLISTEEALKLLEEYQPETKPAPQPEPTPQPAQEIKGDYILMPRVYTKALGLQALREACKQENNQVHPRFTLDKKTQIYRPLTFKENLEARVNDYESNKNSDERIRLFNRWLDSCTGIAYKKKSTKFKIIPECQELITLDRDFDEDFLQIDYSKLQGIELDSNQSKYNEVLTKAKVLNHPAWNAAVEGDKSLLTTYTNIIFNEKQADKLMGFWLRITGDQDGLRALYVYNLDGNSNAYGVDNLDDYGSFLRVAQLSPEDSR